MDKYRLLEHKEEIAKMVKKAPVLEIGEIWQTLPFKREVYKVNRLEALSDAMIFSATIPFDFDNNFPIYIKINFRNLIFKLMPGEFKAYNNQLSCVYPKEAKALESRRLERTRLPKKSGLTLTLRTLSTGSSQDIKVSLEDISERGIGIKATQLNLDYFHRCSVFKIIRVCGRNQLEDCTLTVRHISEKEHKGYIGIGMSSDRPFSDSLYDILRDAIKSERFAA